MTNTKDLSQFGFREIKMASELLNAYVLSYNDDIRDSLTDGITIEFNQDSGKVFLVDNEFNVAMMNDDKLELWYNCSYCGHEGFKEDMLHGLENKECIEYLKQIGVMEE